MAELIRDTAFGHLVRLITKGKVLPYAEDRDPSLWKQYLSEEKTRRMAHHGHPGQLSHEDPPLASSEESSRTRAGSDPQVNQPTGQPIDQEKGRDVNVVDWFGAKDPENPMNWSTFKKVFVTFEICFLTWSVYIGSAIYSAGTETVVKDFGVSQTKATLGLTYVCPRYYTHLPSITMAPISIITCLTPPHHMP